MINDETVSIVTRIMGRLNFLEKSLPSWCAIEGVDKIIIVDWGMQEDLLPLLKIDDRIILLRVPDQKYFDEGTSRNMGINFANTDYVFTIDCDVLINKSPLNFISHDSFVVFKWKIYETGTCLLPLQMWTSINGFFEGLPAWGDTDVDFYERAIKKSYKKIVLPDYITHQDHDNRLRTNNYSFKGNLSQSQFVNRQLMLKGNENQIHNRYLCKIINNKENKIEMV